jgi:NAD(P)-dependent dehydrogenase (short-subunit alcohol dehydrogenase family)
MAFDMQGKTAVVTGSARGIGRATAEALTAAGMKVAIADIDGDLAAETAAEIGGETRGYAVDVSDRGSFAGMLDSVEKEMGPLRVLVNNAGLMPLGPFVDEGDEVADRQLAVNLRGVILGSKLAIPLITAAGGGRLVNVASLAGKVGSPGGATYSATKFAVVGLSETLHEELRGTPVGITLVMPGLIDTELTAGVKESSTVKKVPPADVAAAIADGIRRERFEVFVPKSLGRTFKFTQVLPRGMRRSIAKAMKADKLLVDIDRGERAVYEKRTTGSAD